MERKRLQRMFYGFNSRQHSLIIALFLLAISSLIVSAFGQLPLTGVALSLVPLAAILAMMHGFMFAVLFILFSFFRLHEAFPQLLDMELPMILALTTIASVGLSIAFRKTKPFWDPLFTPYAAFFVVASVGIIFASNVSNSFAFFKSSYVKIGIMVFVLAWSLRSERDIGWLVRAIILAGIAVAAVAIRNKLGGLELVEGTRVTVGRSIRSLLGDPNDLALVLLLSLIHI